MGSGSPVRLRCPDCSKSAGPFNGRPACPGCGRVFEPADGVWNLLPRSLDAVKSNEDEAHVDAGAPTWRRLFLHKRYWIEWCDTRWLPELVDGRTRRFLEIGGGLCYASALAKGRAPQATVVATDVSPRYLLRHAGGRVRGRRCRDAAVRRRPVRRRLLAGGPLPAAGPVARAPRDPPRAGAGWPISRR